MIGAVILTMFMYSDRDYVQTERFSSIQACEMYAERIYEARAKRKTDAYMRYHFCFEDFDTP